jgi:hypothetical protein
MMAIFFMGTGFEVQTWDVNAIIGWRDAQPEAMMKINRQNVKWAVRFMLIILLVSGMDVMVAIFARRPFPLAAIIPALTPMLVVVFIILPMTRAEKS